jgi:hypothetical protein
VNPDNPIVKLCADGMRAESEGRPAEARALFERAWDSRTDDYDACIAAHYVARHRDSPADTLQWNDAALRHAQAVGDAERIRGLLPSLYLNLGHSHEVTGDAEAARRFYELARDVAGELGDDRYGDIVRGAIERALVQRVMWPAHVVSSTVS